MTRARKAAWHGTTGGYSNHFCRCKECTEAFRIYVADYREQLRAKPIPDHVHGTNNGYTNYGCRCVDCGNAHFLARAR